MPEEVERNNTSQAEEGNVYTQLGARSWPPAGSNLVLDHPYCSILLTQEKSETDDSNG